jgi:hypothetical protein
MFHTPKSKAEAQSERQRLEAEIIEDVSTAVDDILTDAPPDWSIKNEVLDHTRFVLGALGISELRSEGARQAHIFNATMDARRLMNLKIAEGRK